MRIELLYFEGCPGYERGSDFGLKCRLYRDAEGATSQPSEKLIRDALARAAGRR